MINHWNCLICKSYNDVLNDNCGICRANKPDWITSEYQARIEINRGIFLGYGILGYVELKGEEVNGLTEQEQLFAKFYNAEKLLVKDMEDFALREHRDELRRIAFEAKARAVAADDEDRDRRTKTKKKEWLLTPDTNEVRVTDAINAVKQRAARMSKMDKMKQQLLAAGLDDETVAEMIKGMERKATEKDVNALTFRKPQVQKALKTEDKPNGEDKSKDADESKPKTNPFSKFFKKDEN